MNKIWLTTLIPFYVMTAVVLIHFGYGYYFNLPNSFVDNSMPQEIILIFQVIQGIFIAVKPWMWIVLLILIIFIWLAGYRYQMAILWIIGILLVIGLFYCDKLDVYLAENQTTYYVLSSDCPLIEKGKTYIMLGNYQNKGIIIRINKSNKMAISRL